MIKANHTHRSMLMFCLLLCIVGLLGRITPFINNFAPVGAIALFAGAMLPNRRYSLWLPVATLLLSDVLLSLIHGYVLWTQSGAFALQRVFDLSALLVIVLAGERLMHHRPFWKVGAFALGGSALFFILSNFGVWLTSQSGAVVGLNYAPSLAGLLHCYEMALPFYRGTLAGDLIYSGVFFGMMAVIQPAPESSAVPHEQA